jgi:hypothetical protein
MSGESMLRKFPKCRLTNNAVDAVLGDVECDVRAVKARYGQPAAFVWKPLP